MLCPPPSPPLFPYTTLFRSGPGSLAVFDGPARAVRCATGIVEGAERLGLSVRVGLHTGECEVDDDSVQGITVHVAGRIDRKSTRLNSSHLVISYAVFCLKKK